MPERPPKCQPPKLPALFPNCMHCRLNSPEKDVVPMLLKNLNTFSVLPILMVITFSICPKYRCTLFPGNQEVEKCDSVLSQWRIWFTITKTRTGHTHKTGYHKHGVHQWSPLNVIFDVEPRESEKGIKTSLGNNYTHYPLLNFLSHVFD